MATRPSQGRSPAHTVPAPRTAYGRELLRECLAVSGFLTVAADGQCIEAKPGRPSPLYLSAKALWKRPDLMAAIDEQLLALNSERSWDVVVGVAFGGIPHAVTLARRLGVPLVLWRGTQRSGDGLAGQVPEGAESALVVEDVVATGSSAAPAVAVLRRLIPTIRLTAIFTYGLDGIIARTRSVDVVTLFPITSVLDLLDADSRARTAVRYTDFQSRLAEEISAARGRP